MVRKPVILRLCFTFDVEQYMKMHNICPILAFDYQNVTCTQCLHKYDGVYYKIFH